MSKFYITTPIYYPNANPHLGHAYTTTLVDILARYHRLRGDETYFLTGVDENSEKIIRAARIAGEQPDAYRDAYVQRFLKLFERLDVSYDQFIRTSDQRAHWPGAQEMWRRLVAAGDIEKRSYKGLYCVGHEAFVTEKDLVDGRCPDHGEAPEVLEEANYFFKLSRYTAALREKILSGEFQVLPQTRRNEILALLERGLEDVSFSRPADKVSVGVPVPGDPEQRIYVWCDALVNYISALGFGREDRSLFARFWPADAHVIGKDILRFHAAIWPAMLLSAKLPLPKRLVVHGFITSGGKKMSKTLGNVIDPHELISEYGAEAVRFFLARHISPFEDGDLTLEAFKDVYNADLANGIGNLISRIMKMAATYDVKEPFVPLKGEHLILKIERELQSHMDAFEINRALEKIMLFCKAVDLSIAETKPYERIKTDPEKARETIAILLSRLVQLAKWLRPFLPETSEQITSLIRENRMPEKPLFPRK